MDSGIQKVGIQIQRPGSGIQDVRGFSYVGRSLDSRSAQFGRGLIRDGRDDLWEGASAELPSSLNRLTKREIKF